MKELHTYGASSVPYHVQFALTNSGLKWIMSPAQWTSVQAWSLFNPTTIVTTGTGEKITEVYNSSAFSLFGIPTEIIDDFQQGWIELRLKDEVLFRIDQLAVITGFPQ